jgi:hypothetical protein
VGLRRSAGLFAIRVLLFSASYFQRAHGCFSTSGDGDIITRYVDLDFGSGTFLAQHCAVCYCQYMHISKASSSNNRYIPIESRELGSVSALSLPVACVRGTSLYHLQKSRKVRGGEPVGEDGISVHSSGTTDSVREKQ